MVWKSGRKAEVECIAKVITLLLTISHAICDNDRKMEIVLLPNIEISLVFR
jgi:hypothetical protein